MAALPEPLHKFPHKLPAESPQLLPHKSAFLATSLPPPQGLPQEPQSVPLSVPESALVPEQLSAEQPVPPQEQPQGLLPSLAVPKHSKQLLPTPYGT